MRQTASKGWQFVWFLLPYQAFSEIYTIILFVNLLEKVTAFVTRPSSNGLDLLLIEHPQAGIQLPAGTVEEGESPLQAVLREVQEETGLTDLIIQKSIGFQEEQKPEGELVVYQRTPVYSRPTASSLDWAIFNRGITVRWLRQQAGFIQALYEEPDQYPHAQYITYQILGWVPEDTLCSGIRRHYFHLDYAGFSPTSWTREADRHLFRLFWAPLDDLPEIVFPQSNWLHYVQDILSYSFH